MSLMDSTVVFRRTAKGEQEVSLRTLPYAPWLALVMVDGKASAVNLALLKPELPDLADSLQRLLREEYIEIVSPQPTHDTSGLGTVSETLPSRRSEDAAAAPAPDLRGHARRWALRGLVLLPFLLAAGTLFLVHRSLERFTTHVEELLATQSGKISIGSSAIVFTPRPALKLANVAVGPSLRASEIIAQPSWSTLVGRRKPITLLELHKAKLSAADLLALLNGSGTRRESREAWAERVTLEDSELEVGGLKIEFSGELSYVSDGKLERAILSIDDGKAQAKLADSVFEFSAREWSLPTTPEITFDQLDASGTLEGTRLTLDRVGALLHDGLVKGSMVLDWNVGLLAEGRFSATNLEMQSLFANLGRNFSVGGRLDADGQFATRGADTDHLLENLGLSADFRVKRGILYNADISGAVAGETRGGATGFDELSGNLQTAGRNLSFRDIKLGSGMLTVKGDLDITPSRQLVGRFSVRLKSGDERASTISVGGSLAEPRLQLGG